MSYYPKHIGGAEVAIKEITDRLSPDEYEFHLICNRYDSTLPKIEKIGNVQVHRIGIAIKSPSMGDLRKLPLHLNKILFQFLAFFKAGHLHKKEKFDAVWSMMAHAAGVPGARFKEVFKRVPFVMTLQEGDPPEVIERKMRYFEPYFTKAFTTADAIQVISNFLGNWAKRKGFPHEPILVPNAVDTAHFIEPLSAEERKTIRRDIGLLDGQVAFITTSRLVKKNGLDSVIDALLLLPKEVVFVVYGLGPEAEALETLARQHGVKDRVLFKGYIEHSVMPKYLKACDVFIRPSRSEGMGNSFIEAMAAELPVIATPVGGITDFLIEGETGWFAQVDNPKSIALAYERITHNSDVTKNILAKAKAMVLEKYDWNLIAKAMDEKVFKPLFENK